MTQAEQTKVLIFGANGQVGRALVNAFTDGYEVIALTRNSSPPCDLTLLDHLPVIIENIKPDIVVNAAAYTAVDRAESEPDLARLVNAKAPSAMAKTCQKLNIPFIHYSTDYVFDGNKNSAYTENDEPCPINTYGQTKLEGEIEIQGTDCQYYILRTSWVYDAEGKNFLNTMLQLAREKETLNVVGDQFGSPTSAEYIAEETVGLIKKILNSHSAESGIYHLTCDGETTWHDFAKEIFTQSLKNGLLDKSPQLTSISTLEFPTPARRPRYSVMSNAKSHQLLQTKKLSWQKALSNCLSHN